MVLKDVITLCEEASAIMSEVKQKAAETVEKQKAFAETSLRN